MAARSRRLTSRLVAGVIIHEEGRGRSPRCCFSCCDVCFACMCHGCVFRFFSFSFFVFLFFFFVCNPGPAVHNNRGGRRAASRRLASSDSRLFLLLPHHLLIIQHYSTPIEHSKIFPDHINAMKTYKKLFFYVSFRRQVR